MRSKERGEVGDKQIHTLCECTHTNAWKNIRANKDKYLLLDKTSSLSAFSCKVVYHWLAITERTPVRLRSIAVSVGPSIAICRQLRKPEVLY